MKAIVTLLLFATSLGLGLGSTGCLVRTRDHHHHHSNARSRDCPRGYHWERGRCLSNRPVRDHRHR